MKYNVEFENGYVKSFIKDENGEYEFDATELKLEYLNCYKASGKSLVLDEEKYQQELAKEEFYNTSVSETEIINEYRIIKESNYNLLITNIILLWTMIGLTIIVKTIRFFKNKQK